MEQSPPTRGLPQSAGQTTRIDDVARLLLPVHQHHRHQIGEAVTQVGQGVHVVLHPGDSGARADVGHDRAGFAVGGAERSLEPLGEPDEALALLGRIPESDRTRHVAALARVGSAPEDDYDDDATVLILPGDAPLLDPDDTIIDGGNADFNATRRRTEALEGTGVHFVGMGVSGGAEGARNGPSMMVGGSDHSWTQFRPMAEAIAAKFKGDPCVAHVGPDGAGHFVKTVHNGIEYADMQLIAEIYGLLRDGTGHSAPQISAVFAQWSEGLLSSYLVETTAAVLAATDKRTGQPMVDVIRDQAGQKGTGRWTLIEALKLGQSANTIEAAVGARGWSSEKDIRTKAEPLLPAAATPGQIPDEGTLAQALLAARILSHAQGFRILWAASRDYDWSLDLARIAEIWRAGCIIRSALLDDIAGAFQADLPDGHLILAPAIRDMLKQTIGGLRQVVSAAALQGLPVPALSAALAWYDTMRQGRGTANMIQAQRDYFGAHGFARIDDEGQHHGDW